MIGIGDARKMFFDRKAVIDKVGAARRKVLSRFGAFVRKTAHDSIRKRKTASQPGNPPHSHEGSLRRKIAFGYDPRVESVVIGPTPLNKVFFNTDIVAVRGIVPEILEYGGTAGVVEKAFRVGGEGPVVWERRDLRRMGKVALLAALRENKKRGFAMPARGGNFIVPTRHHRFRTYHVAARPYMRPAFEKEKPKLPALWLNSVK